MSRRSFVLGLALIASMCAISTAPAHALEIFFEVSMEEEEPFPPGEEGPPGEGEPEFWDITYTITSGSLLAGQGISILFHPDDAEFLFARPGGADWDVIAIQPDPLLPDWGAFDALALVDDPDMSGSFAASFVWLGESPPGVQDFIVYDTDFSILESGVTMPIPEPATALMLGLGLMGLGLAGRRGDSAR